MARSAAAPALALAASEKGEVSFSQPLALPPALLQPSVTLGYGSGGTVHSLSGLLRYDGSDWVWTSPAPADIVREGPNRYSRMAWSFPGNTLSVDYDYCGDDGRLEMREYTTTAAGGRRFFYEYDHLDRITGVELFGAPTEAYSYDDAGSITNMHLLGSVPGPEYAQGWTYAASPRFGEIPVRTTVGSGIAQQFTYDAVGRLMLRQHAPGTANAESSTYSYDSASRLIEVAHSDGSGAVLWYDNDDQVVLEQRTDAAGIGSTVERFGPHQHREGMPYTRVLPHVTLEGAGAAGMRYVLGEPDGRAAWVLTASGSLVSEQVSTVYGLEYDASVWGGVNSAGAWPLGGFTGPRAT